MEPIAHKLPNTLMEKLIERHKRLFDETASRPVIDVGIGWEGIVDKLFTQIEDLWPRRSKCRVDYVREHGGRLEASIRGYRKEDQEEIDKAVLMAHFRAYYVCDECGERGEFRKTSDGWVACRCAFHQTPELMSGRLLYDDFRRPTKLTVGGWVRYGPITDAIEPMSDEDVKQIGLRAYSQEYVEDTVLGTGWYDEDDYEEIKRNLRRLRPDWPSLRYLDVASDILEAYARAERTGYLEECGKRVPLKPDSDNSTWLSRCWLYLRNFVDDQEK